MEAALEVIGKLIGFQITLRRVIPTLKGNLCGLTRCSDAGSGIKSGLCFDMSSITAGKRSELCSDIFVGECSDIFLSDMCCDTWTNFSPGMCPGVYSENCSAIKDILAFYLA